MILVLFGQPNSGKTTLANKLVKSLNLVNIDGDLLRHVFNDKDFSRAGRLKNLNRASDMAAVMEAMGMNVVLSLVYPYQEARDYLNTIGQDVQWIYLTYTGERGREAYHVPDFEVPSDVITLDTSKLSVSECIKTIEREIYFKIS